MEIIEAVKAKRKFLPQTFELTTWEALKPFYDTLLNQAINSKEDLEAWLLQRSELDTAISEDYRWRYVHSTCNTKDPVIAQRLQYYYEEIDPNLNTYSNLLNKKLIECTFVDALDQDKYFVYLRGIKTQIQLFRKENLPLFKEMNLLSKRYGEIVGEMQITYNGQELTMQQAARLLKENDRSVREAVYKLMVARRAENRDELDELFTKLVNVRHQVALNAGFKNYRDYKFTAMGRFDYSVKDCEDFHEAIKALVVPIVNGLKKERKKLMGLEVLKPWDTEVDPDKREALKPYTTGDELIAKSISTLTKVSAEFGKVLQDMNNVGFLDLDSRPGKAPGGYNMGMPESGLPFIFMNATGTENDVRTMVHEAGHAVHSVLSEPLEIFGFKKYPSEVAELASMSMELFTMKDWSDFYTTDEDLKRAKLSQLKGIVKILPWIATIDKFQHWIYTNPNHTAEERKAQWLSINNEFNESEVDWTGMEDVVAYRWHQQLHLFEVPFYYIEYGMAQLGAVAMWKQYLEQGDVTIENYKSALQLGYTKSIPDLYKKAGIQFRFDEVYLSDLIDFLQNQIEVLKK